MKTIAFFNFGNRCILELLVATYTLRKYYVDNIVWCLAKGDQNNEKLAKQVEKLNVTIEWVDFNYLKKNTKSAIKPQLFNHLFNIGYESVIMCDGDLLFLYGLDDLWAPLEKHGSLLTQFVNWKTHGGIMSRRLKELLNVSFLNNEEYKILTSGKPAVNIGVMGFTKQKGMDALQYWAKATESLAGKHIADEIAAHALLLKHNPYIASAKYNASAKIGDLEDIEKNIVIHFHGGAQGGGDVDIRYEDRRKSSRLWLAHLYDFYSSGLVPDAKMWEEFATGGVYSIIQRNPNLPFECYQEFLCK